MSSIVDFGPRLTGAIAIAWLAILAPMSIASAAGSESGPTQSISQGATITKPGVYVLRRDLSSSNANPLITIASDGVTL